MINFKKVELEDQKAYKPYMAQQQCRSCECTFANLYLWSRFYAVTATVENGMLLTKSEEGDYLSYGFPMGKLKYLKEAVDALYEYSKEKKRKFQMHNVTPEQFALLEEIYPGRFQIEYRRDYADYVYEAERKIAVVEEDFFDDQPWYVRLILEGEDRLWRNRETREHNNCVSYSCISEEWCELADKGQCLLEKIIAEETVRELMDLLTERQRQMIQRIYFQQKTQKEVSHELGITVPAVSKCISQAMQKMRNNSDDSARALEKGDWKYAW